MAKAKVNKSDVIRKILSDIGAISKDAPEGWAQTVTTKLAAKGITVSAPMIYQLRTKEMAKAGLAKAKRRKKAGRKAKVVVASVSAPAKAGKSSGPFDALFAVKKLASELGGLDHVASAVQVLKQLG
jgi:hypothetical protein